MADNQVDIILNLSARDQGVVRLIGDVGTSGVKMGDSYVAASERMNTAIDTSVNKLVKLADAQARADAAQRAANIAGVAPLASQLRLGAAQGAAGTARDAVDAAGVALTNARTQNVELAEKLARANTDVAAATRSEAAAAKEAAAAFIVFTKAQTALGDAEARVEQAGLDKAHAVIARRIALEQVTKAQFELTAAQLQADGSTISLVAAEEKETAAVKQLALERRTLLQYYKDLDKQLALVNEASAKASKLDRIADEARATHEALVLTSSDVDKIAAAETRAADATAVAEREFRVAVDQRKIYGEILKEEPGLLASIAAREREVAEAERQVVAIAEAQARLDAAKKATLAADKERAAATEALTKAKEAAALEQAKLNIADANSIDAAYRWAEANKALNETQVKATELQTDYETKLKAQEELEKALTEAKQKSAEATKAVNAEQKTYVTVTKELTQAQKDAGKAAIELATAQKDISKSAVEVEQKQSSLKKIAINVYQSIKSESHAAASEVENVGKKAEGSVSGFIHLGGAVAGLYGHLQGMPMGLAVIGQGFTTVANQGKNFLEGAIESAASFEQKAALTTDILGKIPAGVNSLQQTAFGISKMSFYSADEVMGVIQGLGKAGVDTKVILGQAADGADSLSKRVVDLAAATGTDLPTAVKLETAALNDFKASGITTTQTTNLLASGLNNANITASNLLDTLKQSGSTAAIFGINPRDLIAATDMLGRFGIVGQSAGTSIRYFWANAIPKSPAAFQAMKDLGLIQLDTARSTELLASKHLAYSKSVADNIPNLYKVFALQHNIQTDYTKATAQEQGAFEKWGLQQGALKSAFFNAEGQAKSWNTAVGILYDALGKIPIEGRVKALNDIFGVRGGANGAGVFMEALQQMMGGQTDDGKTLPGVLDQVNAGLDRTPDAGKLLDDKMAGLTGRIQFAKSSWESLKKILGDPFQTPLAKLFDDLGKFVNFIISATQKNPELAKTFAILAGGLTAVAAIVGPLLLLGSGMTLIGAGFAGLAAASVVVLPILAGFGLVLAGIWAGISDPKLGVMPALNSLGITLTGLATGGGKDFAALLKDKILPVGQEVAKLFVHDIAPALNSFLQRLPGLLSQAKGFIGGLATTVRGLLPLFAQAFGGLIDYIMPTVQMVIRLVTQLVSTVGPAIMNVLPGIIGGILSLRANLLPIIEQIAGALIEFLPKAIEGASRFLTTVLFPALAKIESIVLDHVLPAIVQLMHWLGDVWPPIAVIIQDSLANFILPLLDKLGSLFDRAWKLAFPIIDALGKLLVPALQLLGGVLDNVVGPALSAVIDLLGALFDAATGLLKPIGDLFAPLFQTSANAGTQAGNTLAGSMAAAIEANKAKPKSAWDNLLAAFKPGDSAKKGTDTGQGVVQATADVFRSSDSKSKIENANLELMAAMGSDTVQAHVQAQAKAAADTFVTTLAKEVADDAKNDDLKNGGIQLGQNVAAAFVAPEARVYIKTKVGDAVKTDYVPLMSQTGIELAKALKSPEALKAANDSMEALMQKFVRTPNAYIDDDSAKAILAMAGVKTVEELANPEVYDKMTANGEGLAAKLVQALATRLLERKGYTAEQIAELARTAGKDAEPVAGTAGDGVGKGFVNGLIDYLAKHSDDITPYGAQAAAAMAGKSAQDAAVAAASELGDLFNAELEAAITADADRADLVVANRIDVIATRLRQAENAKNAADAEAAARAAAAQAANEQDVADTRPSRASINASRRTQAANNRAGVFNPKPVVHKSGGGGNTGGGNTHKDNGGLPPGGDNTGNNTNSGSTPLGGGNMNNFADPTKGAGLNGRNAATVKSQAEIAADLITKVAAAIKAGVEAMRSLEGMVIPADVEQKAREFADAAAKIVMQIQRVANTSNTIKYYDLVLKWTEIALKSMELISKGVQAFKDLEKFKAPLQRSVNTFVAAVADVTARFMHVNQGGPEQIALTGLWLDTALKVVDLIGKGVDAFIKLEDFVKPAPSVVQQFVTSVRDASADVAKVSHSLSPGDEEAMGYWADAVSKVMDALGKAADLFIKINQAETPLRNAVPAAEHLAADSAAIMANMDHLVVGWDTEHATIVASWGDSVAKVADGLSKAADLFQKLLSPKYRLGNVRQVVYQLAEDSLAMMRCFTDVVTDGTDKPGWNSRNVAKVGAFAESVAKVADGLTKSSDLFQKLLAPRYKLGSVQVAVQALVADALAMMADLRTLVPTDPGAPGWRTADSQTIAAFGDAVAKVAEGLSKATDLFHKLAAPGFTWRPARDNIQLLEQDSVQMAADLKTVATSWDETTAAEVSAYADAVSKVADGLDKALGLFDKLAHDHADLSSIKDKLRAVREQSTAMLDDVRQIGLNWEGFTAPAADWGDAVGKVADGLLKTADFLDKLHLLHFSFSDLAPKVAELRDASAAMLDLVAQPSRSWAGYTEAAGAYADTVGKVADSLLKSFDFLAVLNRSRVFDLSSLLPRVQALIDQTSLIMVAATQVAGKDYDPQGVDKWGDTVGKVAEGLLKGFDLLTKLTARTRLAPIAQVQALAAEVVDVVTIFRQALEDAGRQLSDSDEATDALMAGYADTLGKVTDGLLKGFDLLDKLSTSARKALGNGGPTQWFAILVIMIVQLLTEVNQVRAELASLLDDDLAGYADLMGKVADGLLKPLDLFLALRNFRPVGDGVLTAFQQNVIALLRKIPAIAEAISSEALDAANEFGSKIGPAFTALKDALDVFHALVGDYTVDNKGKLHHTGGFIIPNPARIKNFIASILVLIEALRTGLLDQVAPALLDTANEFGTKLGPAFAVLKDALDLFKGITGTENSKGKLVNGLRPLDSRAIGAFVGSIYVLLHEWDNLISGGEFGGDFANKSNTFADTLRTVLDSLSGIMELTRNIQSGGAGAGIQALLAVVSQLGQTIDSTAATSLPPAQQSFVNFMRAVTQLFRDSNDPSLDNNSIAGAWWGSKGLWNVMWVVVNEHWRPQTISSVQGTLANLTGQINAFRSGTLGGWRGFWHDMTTAVTDAVSAISASINSLADLHISVDFHVTGTQGPPSGSGVNTGGNNGNNNTGGQNGNGGSNNSGGGGGGSNGGDTHNFLINNLTVKQTTDLPMVARWNLNRARDPG